MKIFIIIALMIIMPITSLILLFILGEYEMKDEEK